MKENALEKNLKIWNQLCDFVNALSNEEVEEFIKYGQDSEQDFGDEATWRELISNIRKSK